MNLVKTWAHDVCSEDYFKDAISVDRSDGQGYLLQIEGIQTDKPFAELL